MRSPQGQRGGLRTATSGLTHPRAGRRLVHELKMSAARWLLRSVGYDLDSMIQLSESTIYEEMIRISWSVNGHCTLLEWRAAARARRVAVVELIRHHARRLIRPR